MDAIEQRIQRLEDIEAIRQLKARYFHACDTKDTATIRSCFAEQEVVIDYGQIGVFTDVDAFVEIYTQMACNDHIIDMHHGQNAQISWETPERASAIWDLYFHQINTEASTLTQLGGHYFDVFTRQNGEWKILNTQFNVTSSCISSFEKGASTILFAGKSPA